MVEVSEVRVEEELQESKKNQVDVSIEARSNFRS